MRMLSVPTKERGWSGRVPEIDDGQAGEKSQAGGDTRGAPRADAVLPVGVYCVCVSVCVCLCLCLRKCVSACLRINLYATSPPPSEAAEARFGYHWQWRTAACLSVPASAILGRSHSGRLRREHLAGNGNHAHRNLARNDRKLCARNADVCRIAILDGRGQKYLHDSDSARWRSHCKAEIGYHWQWRTAACLSVPASAALGPSNSCSWLGTTRSCAYIMRMCDPHCNLG